MCLKGTPKEKLSSHWKEIKVARHSCRLSLECDMNVALPWYRHYRMNATSEANPDIQVRMIKMLIQVEAGSRDKKLYNEKTLEYKGTNRNSLPYPYPYGFIIGTSAADGESVDCYLITNDKMKSGSIIDCEPIGLLEQVEDGQIDHKVLAAIPDQAVEPGPELRKELRDFIYAVFAQFPKVRVSIGRILPRDAALHHIQEFRDRK